ncbi:MAG: glycosyltransferase [Anaerolineaceae bacterium]
MVDKHILLISDGRSPTSKRWIDALHKLKFKISLVSTYPLTIEHDVDQTFILPVAFSNAGKEQTPNNGNIKGQPKKSLTKQLIQQFRPIFMLARYNLGPSTIPKYGNILKMIIAEIQPDIVHALRIPFEGMLSRYTPADIPLLVSIWGNDFTLHANANKKMRELTKEVVQRADGIIADTFRDINLAHQWGFEPQKPTLVVPGGGGISLGEIEQARFKKFFPEDQMQDAPIIVNPRGIRAYAQSDIFFQAIPLVLRRFPNAKFFCPAMSGKIEAERWVHRLGLKKSVTLLPELSQKQLWSLFHQSDISVSLTTHDGTPNTLLEAMACGCVPIAGDIDSLREWITPGVNGFLVEINKPNALANAIIDVILNPSFKSRVSIENFERIKSRAEISNVLDRLNDFYLQFL